MSDEQDKSGWITIIPGAGVVGKSWRQTSMLRWGKRLILNSEGEGVGERRELQQAWMCEQTGELDWKPIEMEP